MNSQLSVNDLCRYTGLSVFWYFGVLLILSIIQYFFTDEFRWDFGYILVFWIALSIKDGSATACKWGIFCMLCYGITAAVVCFVLLLAPERIEFENQMNPEYRRFYFAGTFIYVLWSIANLKYLIQILRVRQVRFWTKPVIAGYAVTVVLIGGLSVLYYVEHRDDAGLKIKYADAIELLKRAGRGETLTSVYLPEAMAIAQAHPEIVSGTVFHSPRGGQTVIANREFGGAEGREDKTDIVTYWDYTKGRDGRWAKIKLCIETGQDPNTIN